MRRELVAAVTWGGLILVLAVGATAARTAGLLEPDTVRRLVFGFTGLMVAWYGNRIPKTFVAGADVRRARRVAGWSTTVSGFSYAGLWTFAPLPIAYWAGLAVVAAGVAVTMSYCWSHRRSTTSATV
jgi:hypothetical protein